MDEEPPHLTLASSNGDVPPPKKQEEDWKRDRCMNGIEWDTRELAANMLRVMRGAGRPYDLVDQITAIANRLRDAPEGVTVMDAHEAMWAALADGLKERDDFDGGLDEIERGAIRAVAGRLVKQQTQASAGRREMFDGIRTVERIRERNREETRVSARAMPKAKRRRAKIVKAIVAGTIPPEPSAAQIKAIVEEPGSGPRTTRDYLAINAKRIREGKEPI